MTNHDLSDVYDAFAGIYDRVMRDVDYDSWAIHILNLTEKYSIEVKKILELACGTGSMAIKLALQDYQVVGVDRSQAMLKIAEKKVSEFDLIIPLHAGGMETLESLNLDHDFDLIVCLYDSLNYILEDEKIEWCFREAFNHLRPGGGYIFDVTTEYNLLHNFFGFTFAENFDDASYIWGNDYDITEKICTSDVTIFTQNHGHFDKHVETHTQKVYNTPFLTALLKKTGFEILGKFKDMTEKPITEGVKCERIHYICRKPE